MTEICRTCLQEVSDSSLIFYLDGADTRTSPPITIRCKLARCAPELDLALVPNAIVCGGCLESLNAAYEFKNKYLEAEARIRSFLRREGYAFDCVDLKRVVQHKEEPPPASRLSTLVGQDRDKPTLAGSYFDSFLGESSREADTEETLASKPLDITNLQCNTQEFFAVPKIAQLLAENDPDTFRCSRCGFSTTSNLDLKSHERLHSAVEFHKCGECDYSAPKKQTLIVHMRKHAKEKLFRCSDRSHGTPHRNLLSMQHLRATQSGERPYKCGSCNFATIYISALNKHVRTHTEERACDHEERLTRAELRHGNKKPYGCPLCEYSSSRRTNLRYHMRLHADETASTHTLYKCKMCDYRTAKKTRLREHLRARHAEQEPGVASAKCDQCESCVGTRAPVGEQVPYDCMFCDYRSTTSANLIEHLTIHSNGEPFQCYDCGYKAATEGDLRRHEMAHANKDEASVCVICQKKFENVESLKGHVEFHKDDSNMNTEPNLHSQSNGNKYTDLYSFRNVPDVTRSVAD